MRVSVPVRSTTRSALRPLAHGLLAVLAAAVLSGCAEQAAAAPTPAPVPATAAAGPAQGGPVTGGEAARGVTLSAAARDVSLTHWARTELPVTVGGDGGPVTLRVERRDGVEGDVVEVTPATVTPGDAPTTLTLRPTRVAFPAPEGPAPWTLVASRGGTDVATLDLDVTLRPLELRFTLAPVTAAEGQTVDAVLTVDADVRDLPPLTFSVEPYIAEEAESYGPVGPDTFTVTTLPATVRVPLAFRAFHGDDATKTATFQLSVNGLADTLGSNRYSGKYVRANLTWTVVR